MNDWLYAHILAGTLSVQHRLALLATRITVVPAEARSDAALVMDPVTAGGLLAPLFIAMDLYALRYWKPSTWSKPDLKLLLPGLVAGIGLGYVLFRMLDHRAVAIALARPHGAGLRAFPGAAVAAHELLAHAARRAAGLTLGAGVAATEHDVAAAVRSARAR